MTSKSVWMTVVVGVLGLAMLLPACGGRQRPPESGSCRAGREWVPPHEENGQWVDGYCRSTE
jgi:hypothetical protein